MAHIKLEAALETSSKWQITDASLLRWRKKLKCAARECNDVLHKCKQRIHEDEQIKQEVKNTPFANRIAHATKSFVFSVFSGNNNGLSRSTIERFEWFANGASEFLRFIELGGTPHRHIPFHFLVKNLFAGKELHQIFRGNGYSLFQLWLFPSIAEHGIEASLAIIQKNSNGPEICTYFSIVLQLSESTDIVGITIKCLYLFAPHFKCPVDDIRKELTQLHTQSSPWASSVFLCQKEFCDLHSLGSQCLRPNPFCCKQHDRHEVRRISNSDTVGLSDVSLEPVIQVTFQTFLSEDTISLEDAPYLKAGILFAPHCSLKGILPANKSSAAVAVVGEDQYCFHKDITLEQLKEIMLPKAVDYFRENANATVYQMSWKSEHGSAVIHFEKANMNTRSILKGAQRTFGGAKKRKLWQGRDEERRSRRAMLPDVFHLWGAHMGVKLQSFFMDWMQKEKEGQFTAQQLRTPLWMIRENMGVTPSFKDKTECIAICAPGSSFAHIKTIVK
ncbi:hypothetical protein EJB05_09227, partial [Eragrostis curvula]